MSKLDEILTEFGEETAFYEAVQNGSQDTVKAAIKELIAELVDGTFDKDDAKALEFWRKVSDL